MEPMVSEISPELQAAEARFYRQSERAAKQFGYGATNAALNVAQGSYERLSAALETHLDKPFIAERPGPEGWDAKAHRLLAVIPPDQIALVALNCALRGVVDEDDYTTICEKTGEYLKHELFSVELSLHDEGKKKKDQIKEKIERWVKQRHGGLKQRLQAARSIAKKEGFSQSAQWSPAQRIAVGHFVIDILLQALPDLFEAPMEGDMRTFRVTEDANKAAEEALQQHIRRYPVFLPSEEPPVPWEDFKGGGPVDPAARKLATLVRTRHKETVAAVKRAIADGSMQPALDAVNAVQATPWTINTAILNVMRECRRRGIEVEGLPPLTDLPLPPPVEDYDSLSDEEKKLVRVERAAIKTANRGFKVDRLRFEEDMETADALARFEQFYIPHNLDWRGREYPLCTFNFQRGDYVRALFLFKDAEPIGEEGMEWLKVHLANCGDFKVPGANGKFVKVSKTTFDERIKWTNDNLERIKDCAVQDWECGGPLTPEALSFWTQADKPFLFLAACIELTRALEAQERGVDYVCGLPCSWDGSCSGAQHLCAATRSEDGWKVNLVGNSAVHDLYTIVGNAAKASMARANDPMVSTILAYDGDWRKVFKRNTMTTFYGSKGFGMSQQHMDDLMEPLSLEVMQNKRATHPFGQTRKEHHAASRILAAHAAAAIKGEIPLAIKAMEFIQKLAAMMAHEGKPLEWVSPIGLPWSNRYHDPVTEQVKLWMHDHGVRRRFYPVVADGYKKTINKNHSVNGSAPNFVHACDAAHLLRTVNAARAEGITQFALVHDSFGSLPSHAARFRQIIREEFVRMYEEHDVLTEVLEQAKCDLDEHNDKLSALVDMRADLTGKLNIKEVLNAEYAFA